MNHLEETLESVLFRVENTTLDSKVRRQLSVLLYSSSHVVPVNPPQQAMGHTTLMLMCLGEKELVFVVLCFAHIVLSLCGSPMMTCNSPMFCCGSLMFCHGYPLFYSSPSMFCSSSPVVPLFSCGSYCSAGVLLWCPCSAVVHCSSSTFFRGSLFLTSSQNCCRRCCWRNRKLDVLCVGGSMRSCCSGTAAWPDCFLEICCTRTSPHASSPSSPLMSAPHHTMLTR